jgi:SAM-dependent methyltransferase
MRETRCRSCGSDKLEMVLSLGELPLANALLSDEELAQKEERFRLELVLCTACSLVQITETVPPEKLFRNYLYFSSFSDTMLEHARALVERLISAEKLGPKSLVAEVASNDGYLLQYYAKAGVPVLGIEPARNIAKVAEEKGIRTVAEFFGENLARTLADEGERADVMHANNVLAHVADLNGFVEGFRVLLKDHGVAVIEAPYLKDFVDHCEFDTIYHEHLCYYSLTALDRLFSRHGLVIRDVERLEIHGGSLRIFVSHAAHAKKSEAVERLLAEEAAWGVDKPAFYREFAARVERLRAALREEVAKLRAQGKKIAAYGAAAKGCTLLNYFGIGHDQIDFVADRSTVKQGRTMPGVRIPVRAPEKLLEAQPDYVVLLTWNFADEILAQQAEYRKRGGKFIIPIPEVRIV